MVSEVGIADKAKLAKNQSNSLPGNASSGASKSKGLEVFGFHFKSVNGRFLVVTAAAILAFPIILWLVSYLGGCVASSPEAYCDRLPDFFASALFAFYILQIFGGWVVSAMLIIAALLMLGLAIFLEAEARRD